MAEKLKSKLTSRKFWLSLIGVAAGVAQLFGADGDTVSVICGACMTLIPAVIYVLTEGRIDAQGAKKIASCVSDALDIIAGENNDKNNDKNGVN